MQEAPIGQQHAYLKILLDLTLETRLTAKIAPNTPIFVDDGNRNCMDILKEEFLAFFPITSRRYAFFTMQQPANMEFTTHAAHVRKAGEQAQLEHITIDDLYCTVLISSCTDPVLKTELLKIPTPDINDILAVARQYEMGQNDTTTKAAAAKATTSSSSNTSQKKKDNKPKQSSAQIEYMKERRAQLKGKCLQCGSTSHKSDKCPNKAKLTCSNCSRSGHSASVCLSMPNAQSKQTYSQAAAQAPALPVINAYAHPTAQVLQSEYNAANSFGPVGQPAQASYMYAPRADTPRPVQNNFASYALGFSDADPTPAQTRSMQANRRTPPIFM